MRRDYSVNANCLSGDVASLYRVCWQMPGPAPCRQATMRVANTKVTVDCATCGLLFRWAHDRMPGLRSGMATSSAEALASDIPRTAAGGGSQLGLADRGWVFQYGFQAAVIGPDLLADADGHDR